MSASPFSLGTRILGGAAALLFGVLALGFLLPTDWSASATRILEADAASVYDYLDDPEGWQAWTAWPDSGLVRSGPDSGEGATIAWDDPEFGAGSFRIVEAEPGRRVRYEVEVGGGAMRTRGELTLAPTDGGVEVAWHEEGNLGRNPLMGYWAFFMDRAQTTELERSLGRLSAALSAP